MINKFKSFFSNFMYAISFELAKFIKLNFIIGSKAAFFSLNQCFSPLMGMFGGSKSSSIVFALRTLITAIFGIGAHPTFGLFTSLLYHIPTFCGALYLSSNSRVFKVILPLTCIILFIVHPTGKLVSFYALYWIIPVIIGLLNSRTVFLNCLGSTFVTHAFGTVIWLYSNLLDANSIKLLTSIVWAERLIFAIIMTALYYAITYIYNFATSFNISKLNISTAESN